MSCTEILKARVSRDLKLQVKAIAERELVSEAAWLKRLVVREIRAEAQGTFIVQQPWHTNSPRRVEGMAGRGRSTRPIYVRLRQEDRLLLDARADARGLRPATYVSVLTRAHLRRLAPLPKEELLVLKRSIGDLAAIGRNINQIIKVANEDGRLPTSAREEFRAMLKICEALRDNTKALLKANVTSWQAGHDEANL